ncbi:DUF6378 domain-containing protein [Chromobacterium haemolyticum]|uniref:DUF6378 domain-containing protein n=1 Tax=Chromobacterium TaxID=535 RepID=UPI0040562BB8
MSKFVVGSMVRFNHAVISNKTIKCIAELGCDPFGTHEVTYIGAWGGVGIQSKYGQSYCFDESILCVAEVSKSKPQTAIQVLEEGMKAMKDRAKLRDSAGGERSMQKAIEAFNALTGLEMDEEEGWLFMALLKASRSRKGEFHLDDYIDGAAYFALAGEAAAKEAKQ